FLGGRFRAVGWGAMAVLLITGVLNLHYRGMLSPELWADPAFRGSPLGRALGWKLAAVLTMFSASAIHDFVLGPAASRLDPTSVAAGRTRRWASWLARINAVVGIVVVFAAVRLARGG